MAVLTVSQLNFYIKSMLDDDPKLRTVYLKGEISNFTDHYRTGHMYMSLKDERSAVKAVMFAGYASRLKFRPEDGMKVLVRGNVSLYSPTGQYQFYIEDMQPDGLGALSLAFEQLKKKLSAEGIFSDEHKKTLPVLPERIGVITSPTGAAVQDILRILKRRYPIGEIIMCPVLVQGENAAAQLTDAVRKFDRLKAADVIIIGRGGGSAEELWAFNDENLARAIYDCSIPVVSGVGHETDFTICDLAADVRASTPSAAAEIVSPEEGELYGLLQSYYERLRKAMSSRIIYENKRLDTLSKTKVLRSPMELVRHKQMQLDMLSSTLNSLYKKEIAENRARLERAVSGLEALSPLKVLSRGYSMTIKNGRVISSASQLSAGDIITLKFADGTTEAAITGGKINEKN